MSYCNSLLFNKKSIILCSKFVLKLYFLNLGIEKLTVLQRLRKTVSFLYIILVRIGAICTNFEDYMK